MHDHGPFNCGVSGWIIVFFHVAKNAVNSSKKTCFIVIFFSRQFIFECVLIEYNTENIL